MVVPRLKERVGGKKKKKKNKFDEKVKKPGTS